MSTAQDALSAVIHEQPLLLLRKARLAGAQNVWVLKISQRLRGATAPHRAKQILPGPLARHSTIRNVALRRA